MATRGGDRQDEPFEGEELTGETRERDVDEEDDLERRFSRGQEVLGETPEKEQEGRFSEGLEEETDRSGLREDQGP